MGLVAEGRLDDGTDWGKGGRVGGILESVQYVGAVFVREIEFARGARCNVVSCYTIDFFTEGLNGDCTRYISCVFPG